MAETVDTVVTETPAQTPEKPKRKMPVGRPFTSEQAKALQASANAAKKLRREMRAKMLQTVVNEGLERYLAKAIKSGDEKLMSIVVSASKLTGIDWTSSEEAVQRVDAKVDQKTHTDGTIKFVIEDAK